MSGGHISVKNKVMTTAWPTMIEMFLLFIILFSGSSSLYTTEKITNKIRKVNSKADKNSVIGFPLLEIWHPTSLMVEDKY